MNFYQGMVLQECFLDFCLIFPEVSDTEHLGDTYCLGQIHLLSVSQGQRPLEPLAAVTEMDVLLVLLQKLIRDE